MKGEARSGWVKPGAVRNGARHWLFGSEEGGLFFGARGLPDGVVISGGQGDLLLVVPPAVGPVIGHGYAIGPRKDLGGERLDCAGDALNRPVESLAAELALKPSGTWNSNVRVSTRGLAMNLPPTI